MIFLIEGARHHTRIDKFGDIEEIKRPFGEPFGLNQIKSDRRGERS